MKMSSTIFWEFLFVYANASWKRPKEYQNKTADEIWKDMSVEEKVLLKKMASSSDPEIDWLEVEEWLENQFREDIKKDPVDVACMCIKKLKLSREAFISVASVSANVKDEVLSDIAAASNNQESS